MRNERTGATATLPACVAATAIVLSLLLYVFVEAWLPLLSVAVWYPLWIREIHRLLRTRSRCAACGDLLDSYWDWYRGTSYCETHCLDHVYRYEKYEGWWCVNCGAPPPDDWHDAE